MKLESVEYSEYKGTPSEWSISDFTLTDINLIVGKNAAGKSRTLRVLNGLAMLISGKRPPLLDSTWYRAIFSDNSVRSTLKYEIEIDSKKVKKEVLTVDGAIKVNLMNGSDKYNKGTMVFEKEEKLEIEVQIPETSLAVTVRRDKAQHSYLEPLHQWAQSVQLYQFARNYENSISFEDTDSQVNIAELMPAHENIVMLVRFGFDHIGLPFKKSVMEDMKAIGYDISEFGITNIPQPIPGFGFGSPKQPQMVFFKEKGVAKKLFQNELSHGMFCAFAVLVQFRVNLNAKQLPFILIDDIGEGLDYDRSTKLISLLIEIAEKGKFQIAMTTNDRFVMNKVPLKYWCVINRERGIVKAITPRNSPKIFEDFEEYGSNNFDFFSKKFYLKNS